MISVKKDILLFAIFSVGIGIYFYFFYEAPPVGQVTTPLESQPRSRYSSTPAKQRESIPYTHKSPDTGFSFTIYYPESFYEDSQECKYEFKDDDRLLDIRNLVGRDTIICSSGYGSFWGSFVGWAENGLLLIKDPSGAIRIIDVKNIKISYYDYDSNEISFEGVNKTLDYWLFRRGPKESFVLLDKNKRVVLADFAESVDRPVLYDWVNDGFILISRIEERQDYKSVQFNFLSVKDLSIDTVLITEPEFVPGMGCSPEKIVASKPGEIIISQGCLRVGEEYKDSDHNIQLLL